jgi:protein CpxP
MLKKFFLLAAIVAVIAFTQVWAADEPAGDRQTPPPPPPARERTAGMARGMGGAMGMGMGRAADVTAMFQQLDLSEEQKTKLKEIQEANNEKIQTASEAQWNAMMKVNGLVMSGGSEAEIRAAATEAGKAMGDAAVARAKTIEEMKKVLTPEQKTKFEEQQKQRAAQMAERRASRGTGERPAAPAGRGPEGGRR